MVSYSEKDKDCLIYGEERTETKRDQGLDADQKTYIIKMSERRRLASLSPDYKSKKNNVRCKFNNYANYLLRLY